MGTVQAALKHFELWVSIIMHFSLSTCVYICITSPTLNHSFSLLTCFCVVHVCVHTKAPLHKTFCQSFLRQKSRNSGKKNVSIAICIEVCQSFFMAKKSLAKSFMQRGPGTVKCSTVEPRYNEVLGTMKITLLYEVSHYIRVKKRNIKSWDQQNYLVIRGFCYIRPLYNEVPL